MKRLMLRWFLPFGVIAAIFSLVWWARTMEFIPPAVGLWLWPALVAASLLTLGLIALLTRSYLWLWPFAAAFLVQVIGLFLLASRTFETAWEPFFWSLGAAVLVLLVMGGIWLFNTFRARGLERKMAQGMAEGHAGNEQELGRIRKDMLDALSLLRRAGRGRNAIYELPWFLVMGRPAAGKTVAIKNSDLGLPVRKDWVKGVGGTYTCDWFFTHELIFLDTPGKWVTDGADESARKQWKQLIRLLKKFRGRRPLDGLIVVVPADDLLSKEEAGLEEQAANARDVVDLMHKELDFRFPVYILVTKCDLVKGFVEFFRALPAQRKHEILGWSNEDPNRRNYAKLIHDGFKRVQRRLEAYRIEMLGRVWKRTQARKLFFFTEEFKALEEPLTVFADAFFQSDRFSDAPVFRGFYFTSGTQGEGAALSRAMSNFAQTLGVSTTAEPEKDDEPKRSYFLKDLFRELMVGDEGLVGRTAGHWWRQRRNTMLGAFAPAGVALLIVLFSLISFVWNGNVYDAAASRTPGIVQELDQLMDDPAGDNVLSILDKTGQLRRYHHRMSSFSPLRTLGMRRPGPLADRSLAIFQQQFSRAVLEPTLSAAEAFALGPAESCADKIDLLHSVVWLRMGRRAQWSADLAGFDTVWSNMTDEQVAAARKELLRQYGYFLHSGDDTRSGLLPGFSIRKAARQIQEQCADQGATSAVAMFIHFQEQCGAATTHEEIESCATRMHGVLGYSQKDYERFVRHFADLKSDLEELKIKEGDAGVGLDLLKTIEPTPSVADGEAADVDARCLRPFAESILPELNRYAVQDEMLAECRDRVAAVSKRGAKYKLRNEILAEQQTRLTSQEEDLRGLVGDYNVRCQTLLGSRLDLDVLKKVAAEDRRVRCLPQEMPKTTTGTVARTTTTGTAVPATRPKRAKSARKVSSTTWLRAGYRVPSAYRPTHWAEQRAEWIGTFEAAQEGYDDAQRALLHNEIRGEVTAYARAYAKHWTRYLHELEINGRTAGVPDWLEALAQTTEFSGLIGPAADAAKVAETAGEAPFEPMREQLRALSGLVNFVTVDIAQYQGLLREVAADLERCQKDSRFFLTYRNAVASGDESKALVKAAKWVGLRAGPNLANNALQEMLRAPLVEARAFVQSDSLLKGQWADLLRLYSEQFVGRSPFDGGIDAEQAVTFEGLRALLGGATGAVVRTRAAAGDAGLSSQADAWLKHAEELSAAFFKPGSDELRPIKARIKIGEPDYEPKNVSKKRRLHQVRMHFGDGSEFVWNEGDEPVARLDLPLFCVDGSVFRFLRGVLAEKKNMLKRVIGSNWKEGAVVEVTRTGRWAPMALIGAGRGDGAASGPDLQLRYALVFPMKEKGTKTATITLPVELSCEQAPRLLELMARGLDPPPSLGAGN